MAIFDLYEEAGSAHAEAIGGSVFLVNVNDEPSVSADIDAADGVARILVNCAGVAPAIKTVGKDAQPHALDACRRTIEINLVGTFTMISKLAV